MGTILGASSVRDRATPLLIQLLFTEALSIFILGFTSGHWLAGFIAPIWGIAILPLSLSSLDNPTNLAVLPFAVIIAGCLVTVVLAIVGRCRRIWGHICLLIYNLLSFLVLLGLK